MFQRTCHSLGPDLQSRFKFQQHDFFLPQPIKPDAEVKAYILRYVLWNWSDDDCIRILQSFVPVLRNSLETVLLINDGFCPVPGSFEPHVEKGSRQLDIAMMVMFNSKSRMEYQWKELLAKTSVNLKESTIPELHDERY